MSRLKQQFKNYFSFSHSELISVTIFIFLIIIIFILPYIYNYFKKEEKTNFTEFDKQIKIFDSVINKANDTTRYSYKTTNNRKQIYNNKQQAKSTNQKIKYFNKYYFVVEINAADSFALMRLKGIGHSFAKRIINYRKLLGGYCKKEQLLEVWGIDSARFNLIKEHIIVNIDSINKININKATFKKLLKHPYLNYDIALGLANYKKIHGDFKDIADVNKCSAINDSIFERISPYIDVK